MNLRRAGLALVLVGSASGFGCGGSSSGEPAAAERQPQPQPVPIAASRQAAAEPACEATWQSARVAGGPIAGPGIAVDAVGRPHVAFTRSVQGGLVHATPGDDGAWATTVVADEGWNASIAASSEQV